MAIYFLRSKQVLEIYAEEFKIVLGIDNPGSLCLYQLIPTWGNFRSKKINKMEKSQCEKPKVDLRTHDCVEEGSFSQLSLGLKIKQTRYINGKKKSIQTYLIRDMRAFLRKWRQDPKKQLDLCIFTLGSKKSGEGIWQEVWISVVDWGNLAKVCLLGS